MWNLSLPLPRGNPLLRHFDRHFSLSALITCSILGTVWFLLSRRSGYLHSVGGLSIIHGKRLVVFGDSWSDPNDGQVRIWTECLCSTVSHGMLLYNVYIDYYIKIKKNIADD